MNRSVFLFMFLTLGVKALCQTITVKDGESGEPLGFVSIYNQKSGLLVNTDANGQADIAAFENLEKIEIRLFGYRGISQSYDQIKASGYIIMLQPTAISLQQAVVSASKWSQSRQEIPARISTISKEDADLLNIQTAADLLGISGEVFIQKSQQGGGSPMIRGFSTNRLLYTVDGVRMNTAIFRSGNIQNVISLDPFAIENTEVFFGPGSIIYGSDAIGAVMSFQTLEAKLSTSEKILVKGNAVLRSSTANREKTGHIDLNIGWKKWASVTSFSRNQYGDLRMGRHGPDEYLRPFYAVRVNGTDVLVNNEKPRIQIPTGYTQTNIMQKVRYKPNKDWDFDYGFHYSETSPFSRYDRHIRLQPNGQPRSAEWRYGPQIWSMNNLKISYDGGSRLFDQLTLRLAHQYFEESRIDRNFNDITRRIRTEEVNAFSANLDFLKIPGDDAKIFYGLEFVKNNVISTGADENILSGARTRGPARYPASSWNSAAAYLSYQRKVSGKSLIQGGLRYNLFALDADFNYNLPFYPLPFSQASVNNSAITGSLGLVFNPSDTWTMHANISTGFRSPNVDDIGKIFDSEPGTVLIPNPDLKAEYAYNTEVNVGKVLGDNVMIDLTGYYTILDNAIVRRDFLLNGQDSIIYDGGLSRVLALQNAAFAKIYGVQAALEVKLPYGFGISSRLNIQNGTEETDDGTTTPSRHAPPWFGLSRLEFKRERFRMQFYVEYSGSVNFDGLPLEEKGKPEIYAIDTNGNPYSPSWLTFNYSIAYRISRNFSLSSGVENIADQRYRTYSSGIVAPGRNFNLSLRGNF